METVSRNLFPPPPDKNREEHPLSLIVIPGVEVMDAETTEKGMRQFTCAQWMDVKRTSGQGNDRANAERDMTARLRELLRAPPLPDDGNTPKIVGCFYLLCSSQSQDLTKHYQYFDSCQFHILNYQHNQNQSHSHLHLCHMDVRRYSNSSHLSWHHKLM